jgi:hypothetical protein
VCCVAGQRLAARATAHAVCLSVCPGASQRGGGAAAVALAAAASTGRTHLQLRSEGKAAMLPFSLTWPPRSSQNLVRSSSLNARYFPLCNVHAARGGRGSGAGGLHAHCASHAPPGGTPRRPGPRAASSLAAHMRRQVHVQAGWRFRRPLWGWARTHLRGRCEQLAHGLGLPRQSVRQSVKTPGGLWHAAISKSSLSGVERATAIDLYTAPVQIV